AEGAGRKPVDVTTAPPWTTASLTTFARLTATPTPTVTPEPPVTEALPSPFALASVFAEVFSVRAPVPALIVMPVGMYAREEAFARLMPTAAATLTEPLELLALGELV